MSQPKRRRPPRKSINSTEAWKKMEDTGHTLGIARCLGKKDSKRVSEAVASLNNPQISRKRRKYGLFLHDVLRKCGPHGVLLSAISLGQSNVIDMSNHHRAAFVRKLEEKQRQPPINDPIFRTLADRNKVPNSSRSKLRPSMIPKGADWSVPGDTTSEEQNMQDGQQEFLHNIRSSDEETADRQDSPDNANAPGSQFIDTESQYQNDDNVRVQDGRECAQYYGSSEL